MTEYKIHLSNAAFLFIIFQIKDGLKMKATDRKIHAAITVDCMTSKATNAIACRSKKTYKGDNLHLYAHFRADYLNSEDVIQDIPVKQFRGHPDPTFKAQVAMKYTPNFEFIAARDASVQVHLRLFYNSGNPDIKGAVNRAILSCERKKAGDLSPDFVEISIMSPTVEGPFIYGNLSIDGKRMGALLKNGPIIRHNPSLPPTNDRMLVDDDDLDVDVLGMVNGPPQIFDNTPFLFQTDDFFLEGWREPLTTVVSGDYMPIR